MASEGGEPGCMYNYVVTAHKPTGVTHAVVGNFTSPKDTNLIVGKYSRLEIHTLQAQGLQGVLDVPLYGRIAALKLFRPKGESTDLLLLLTERYKICVLQYDTKTGELITRASGDVMDKIGTPAKYGQMGFIDPECRLIGLHLYDGLLKVIPVIGSHLQEAFNIRLEELKVLDMCFLDQCARPTIALLYEDTKEARHIRTYEVNVKDKDLIDGPLNQMNIDNGAEIMIPVKNFGGLLVLGESMITYFCENRPHVTIPVQETTFRAFGGIDEDGSRYLLGDFLGNLYMLVLVHDGESVLGLKIHRLGRTSLPSALCYLDSSVCFVGSKLGDSQLIRLRSSPTPPQSANYIEPLDAFTNLGPIVDFCVVDLDRQGQCQVVTCSGAFLEGSLRIVRNGIGITEQATVEITGIKGLWSLKKSVDEEFDTYLVLTFVNETRILAINESDELDEASIRGFDADAQTLHCSNVLGNQLVQITSTGISLIDTQDGEAKASWKPPAGYSINMASSSLTQAFLAGGQGQCVYIEFGKHEIREVGTLTMEGEVSCVDITPFGEDPTTAKMVAIGTWNMNLHLYKLPELTPISQHSLSTEVIPRSILFTSFEGCAFLLCAMGDGALISWRVDGETGEISDNKKMSLGTRPVTLTRFWTNGMAYVFAASDRPTVIYGANKKLLYSNLNENDVNFLTSFNSASFPNSLALAKEGSMTIGSIDEIQKLHIRTVPLQEGPRRICHQPETKTFGVLVDAVGEAPMSYFRVFEEETFEVLDSLPLDANESGQQLLSTSFANDPNTYFIIGTAYVFPNEEEPSRGRILVVLFENGKIQVIAEKEVKGPACTLNSIQGKLLASVKCKVHILEWRGRDDDQHELVITCTHHGYILALYVAVRGDFIVVGDLMRSMVLLLYKSEEGQLEERARHYDPNWMRAVSILDDDIFLGAEDDCNLFTVRRNSDSAVEEEQALLTSVGEFHLGESVNRFQHGSLVMRVADSELANVPTVLFGTVGGMIGVIASLPHELFVFLEKLQDSMRRVVRGIGGLDHKAYRMFRNDRRTVEARNFIDGDLIEAFLDLRREKMMEVVADIANVTVEEVCKIVEELSRLH